MLTVKQAALVSGLSASLIYLLCAQKKLAHLRCGTKGRRGRVLIAEADLAAFMESCRIGADIGPTVKPHAPPSGAFRNLDAGRLQAAWRERGALEG